MNTPGRSKVVNPLGAPAPCKTCHGTKTVTAVLNKGTPREQQTQVKCPACAGTGQSGLRVK